MQALQEEAETNLFDQISPSLHNHRRSMPNMHSVSSHCRPDLDQPTFPRGETELFTAAAQSAPTNDQTSPRGQTPPLLHSRIFIGPYTITGQATSVSFFKNRWEVFDLTDDHQVSLEEFHIAIRNFVPVGTAEKGTTGGGTTAAIAKFIIQHLAVFVTSMLVGERQLDWCGIPQHQERLPIQYQE